MNACQLSIMFIYFYIWKDTFSTPCIPGWIVWCVIVLFHEYNNNIQKPVVTFKVKVQWNTLGLFIWNRFRKFWVLIIFLRNISKDQSNPTDLLMTQHVQTVDGTSTSLRTHQYRPILKRSLESCVICLDGPPSLIKGPITAASCHLQLDLHGPLRGCPRLLCCRLHTGRAAMLPTARPGLRPLFFYLHARTHTYSNWTFSTTTLI